jgi:hypothetical protein
MESHLFLTYLHGQIPGHGGDWTEQPSSDRQRWGLVRGAVAVGRPPIRSSPVTSRIQPPKLICIVPSNSAGVGGRGERAARQEGRRNRRPAALLGGEELCGARASRRPWAFGRQSGQDATRAASPRGWSQSGRRRGVQAAAAPWPLSLPSR